MNHELAGHTIRAGIRRQLPGHGLQNASNRGEDGLDGDDRADMTLRISLARTAMRQDRTAAHETRVGGYEQ